MRLTNEERCLAQEVLSVLVGQPLSCMWRYASCQKFEFGSQNPRVNRKGHETTRADWGFVANCCWCVRGPSGFLLSWDDFGPALERRDKHAETFYQSLETDPPVVELVEVDENGGIRIEMTGGYRLALDLKPNKEDDTEAWRFIPPDDDSRGHFVLGEGELGWSRR